MIRLAIKSLVAAAVLLIAAASGFSQSPTPAPAAVSKANEAKYGVYPIAYREIIMRWLETQLLDAKSAKIEWLGDPQPIEMKGRDGAQFAGYVVEFKVNARNRFGTYAGSQARRVYIRNGEVAGGSRKGS